MVNDSSNANNRRLGIAGWLLYLPLAAWLLALVAAPTVLLVLYSFCDRDDDGQPVFKFTLDNYRELFDPALLPFFERIAICLATAAVTAFFFRRRIRPRLIRWGLLLGLSATFSFAIRMLPRGLGTYLKIFWKSSELASMTAILCLVIGYPVAYFVGRSTPVWRNRLLLLVMIPFWTSFVIRTYAWVMILNQNGWLNFTLKGCGLSMLIPESGEVLYTPAAVVIGLVYAYLPFMILPIYGSVEKLDDSLIEASLDLGAGPIRTLVNVILPLTAPGMSAGLLLVFVPAIAMFAVTDVMSGNKLQLLGSQIEDLFQGTDANPPLGAAMGVTLMLLFGLVFLVTGFKQSEEIA